MIVSIILLLHGLARHIPWITSAKVIMCGGPLNLQLNELLVLETSTEWHFTHVNCQVRSEFQ